MATHRWLAGITAALLLASAAHAVSPPPERAPVRRPIGEAEDQGYRIRLDLSRQVLRLEIPEDRSFGEGGAAEAPILPVLPPARDGFVSASMLAQKAKQFDDGLYAAVELAAQNGAGKLAAKAAMLRTLSQAIASAGRVHAGSPQAILLAACRLGHQPVSVAPDAEPAVQAATSDFLADSLRSKPIGFYTWTEPLSNIFRQDRMLQSELKGHDEIGRLVRILHDDPGARATYETYLSLVSRLTNPLVGRDLRPLLAELDRGRLDPPGAEIAFFPASRSMETDLIKKLYGNRPIPEEFSLIDEAIRRIRTGDVDLRPGADSGWYDYQTWALEPLVVPERMPEASHLTLDESYRMQLLELFKGVLALTRETHIKQLEIAPTSAAPAQLPPKVRLYVHPELEAEPLATYYLRRAQSYGFIRQVLEQAFGREALRGMRRLTATGPVPVDLATELERMESLFLGAHAAINAELGLAADPGSTRSGAPEVFRDWAARVGSDPDVGRDARMMVPVFYDLMRRKTKVWAFLGWAERPLFVDFGKPPGVKQVLKGGQEVDRDSVEVNFYGQGYSLAYPVTAELYVSRILDRDEFHRLCDRYKTRAAILEHLR